MKIHFITSYKHVLTYNILYIKFFNKKKKILKINYLKLCAKLKI